jgi:myo-inositol-1(or 4)-monophosphatase
MTTPDRAQLPAFLSAAVEAARRGAAELERWRTKFSVREKFRADLVTDADHASQKVVKESLLGAFPDHLFLGEEESVGKSPEDTRPPAGTPPVWVVDPLDGTSNYVHDVPAYCVSIGLWAGGKPVVGVILDPRMNELFTAAAGLGAFLNGKPIRVSAVAALRDGMISTGFPADYQKQLRNIDAWTRVSAHAQSLRRTGSTALNMAYVAAGRFDGYWAYDNWAWDVTAGAVLVAEAGGTLSTADGQPLDPFRPDILATNGRIHAELLRVLSSEEKGFGREGVKV